VTARTSREDLLKAYEAALPKIEQLSAEKAAEPSVEASQRALEKALT